MALTPSLTSTPQLAAGAWMPRPRKLKNASVKMAVGMVSVMAAIMGPIALGMRCLKRMRAGEAPMARAAVM